MRTESWLGILLGLAVAAEAAAQSNEAAQTFREHVAARAEAALTAGEPVVKGEDGWLFPSAELRHLGVGPFWGAHAAKTARATNPDRVDPLPAIVDFHRQLTQAGIELWVVPVPPKAVIYPEKVFPKSEPGTSATVCLDSTLVAFYRSLAEQGVEVVDLTDALLAAKATSGASPRGSSPKATGGRSSPSFRSPPDPRIGRALRRDLLLE